VSAVSVDTCSEGEKRQENVSLWSRAST